VVDGFDPLTSVEDRRILFEVTGMRLYRDEFRDQNSSDESDEEEDEGDGGAGDLNLYLD